MDADRDLIFGLLAERNGLIDRDRLVAAIRAFAGDRGRSLADRLVEDGAIDGDDRAVVEAMVGRHLNRHGGDPSRGLDAIPGGRAARRRLAAKARPGDEGGVGLFSGAGRRAMIRLGRRAGEHRVALAAVALLAISTGLLAFERARVGLERRRAEAVHAFLTAELLGRAAPEDNPAGDRVTLLSLVDRAAEAVEAEGSRPRDPGVEGPIRAVIGRAYADLGRADEARPQLERALVCRSRAGVGGDAERLAMMDELAWVIYRQGEVMEARARGSALLKEVQEVLGPDHEVTLDVAGHVAEMNAPAPASLPLFRWTIAGRTRLHGPEDPRTLREVARYAWALTHGMGADKGGLAEGLALYESRREVVRRVLGPDDPEAYWWEVGRGGALGRAGRSAEARALLAPLRDRLAATFGPDHLILAAAAEAQAAAEERLGDLEAAAAGYAEALAIRRRHVGEDSGALLGLHCRLARVCLARGEARAAAEHAAAVIRRHDQFKAMAAAAAPGSPDRLDEAGVAVLARVLDGRADPLSCRSLIGQLRQLLDSYLGEGDWFRRHIGCLEGEAWCQMAWTTEHPADVLAAGREMVEVALEALESDPATPRRILEQDRARLIRSREAAAEYTSATPAGADQPS